MAKRPVKKPRPKHVRDRPPVAFRLPAELVASVDGKARTYGQSRNRMVEILLRRALDGFTGELVLSPIAGAEPDARQIDLFA